MVAYFFRNVELLNNCYCNGKRTLFTWDCTRTRYIAINIMFILSCHAEVQRNGGRKKGAAEKENGVESLTRGAGDQNLLKKGGARSVLFLLHHQLCLALLTRTRKEALSDAEILQHLESDGTQPRVEKESNSMDAAIPNRKCKVVQKAEVMQQVLAPSKASENIMGSPPKKRAAKTTRAALRRMMTPSSKVLDQVSRVTKTPVDIIL